MKSIKNTIKQYQRTLSGKGWCGMEICSAGPKRLKWHKEYWSNPKYFMNMYFREFVSMKTGNRKSPNE